MTTAMSFSGPMLWPRVRDVRLLWVLVQLNQGLATPTDSAGIGEIGIHSMAVFIHCFCFIDMTQLVMGHRQKQPIPGSATVGGPSPIRLSPAIANAYLPAR